MSVIFIRAVFLYILVIFSVRLMGKRQLGELQPSELVITILVSNIATLPIEDTDIPLIVGITPILTLVCSEVIMSWLSLRYPRLRRIISGSPKVVISGGSIDPKVLRELRFSVDDLMTALRGQDIFDVSEVQYAIVETTGSISVMKKAEADVPKCRDIGITPHSSDPPQVIAADGRILTDTLKSIGMEASDAEAVLSAQGVPLSEVLLMTADGSGSFYIALKSGGDPIVLKETK